MRGLPGSIGIGAGAIAADDLNRRTLLPPRRRRCGLPIRRQIQHAAALQVHENRALTLAFSPGPIVSTEDTDRLYQRGSRASHQTQQRVAADRHRQTMGQARTRFAAQGKPDLLLRLREGCGAAGLPAHGSRERFDKRPLGTCHFVTEEAPGVSLDGRTWFHGESARDRGAGCVRARIGSDTLDSRPTRPS